MNDDLLAYIRLHYNTLTRTGQQIADFVLEHGAEIVRMSISQAAKACGVGESTFHRFCHSVGQEGYTDLRLSLAECLRDRQYQAYAPRAVIDEGDPCGMIVSRLCETMKDALHQTLRLLDVASIISVTERLRAADHIALLGMGGSMPIALHAYQRFMRSMPKAVCPQTDEMQRLTADGLSARDVAIIFPDEKLEQHALDLVRRCKNGRAYVICMTDDGDSPLPESCDQSCRYAINPQEEQAKKPSMYCALGFLIEAICMIHDFAPRDINGYARTTPRTV